MGRNDIARELGISGGKVSKDAKRLRLLFDGSQVLMATEARRREAAERRAVLSIALLDDAEKLRERLFKPMKYVQYGGKDFERQEDTFPQPIPQDQAHLVRAITTLVDRARQLDEYDRIGSTLADAFSYLDQARLTIFSGTVIPGSSVPAVEGGGDAGDHSETTG